MYFVIHKILLAFSFENLLNYKEICAEDKLLVNKWPCLMRHCGCAAVSYFYDYRYLYSRSQIQKKYFALLECSETAVFLQAVSKLFRLFVDRMQNRF